MMKALTEFLASGLKIEQPKATLQGGDSATQPFAETMEALLASTTGESQKLTSVNELTDLALDGLNDPANSELTPHTANLTAGSDSKTPMGDLAEQPRHLIEAETKHQLMGDFTMDIMKPGQETPKAVQDTGTSSTDPVGMVAALTELNEKSNSPANFQAAMNDLTSASIPAQVIVTNDLLDSQGVPASTVIADESLDSPIGITATYVETSAQQVPDATTALPNTALSSNGGAGQGLETLQGDVSSAGSEEFTELSTAPSSTSVLTNPAQSELSNKATSAAIPTEITLNMVEAGRKFAGHLSETPNNTATVTSTTASNASAYTAGVATRDVVGVDNSLARTEGAVRGAELPGVAERLPLNQAADRPSVDPRVEVATDRAALASSAAVVKTELTGRQPVSFDAGIKLSNTEPQQFAGEMATHVRVLKSQSGGEVKLNLHPAELGRMSISVSTEGNETRVAFVVETSQARQAVETALPRLRDMLEDAGLSLSDSDVSEQRDAHAGADERGSGGSRGGATSPDSDDVSATTVVSLTVDPDRLVDTYI